MEKQLRHVALKDIHISDSFWNTYVDLVEKIILPFQWELIHDRVEEAAQVQREPFDDCGREVQKSGCIRNFRIASGAEQGEHQGAVFQDTDLAKWLEAAAFCLAKKPNAALEAMADEAIGLIESAQCPDGYLNTYYTITGEPRWSNLFEGHELYTAGHMIEAAVAYYEATGKRRFLDIVCRLADHIDGKFGRQAGKLRGYPGHPEIELALVKLYRTTGEQRYLELANYFVRERGAQPCYFLLEKGLQEQRFLFPEFKDFGMDYCQAHLPLSEQKTAEGHAVRAVYLYSAMADIAGEHRDEELLGQCAALWSNITEKRMYVTGSIGSAAYGERFTTDYDLPNNTNYSESCATIGLAMFSDRMLRITRDGKYGDVVELALYNALLAGIALDGKHFFYVNPLEVVPDIAEKNPTMKHVDTVRRPWFGVACCPPNIARTLASLGNYIYATDSNAVFVNLFIASTVQVPLESGAVSLSLHAAYPVEDTVRIAVHPAAAGQIFTVAVRKPAFSGEATVTVNGQQICCTLQSGYFYIERAWSDGDEIAVTLDVSFRFVRCNPRVRDNIGRVALMKGPWVYCLEEADNGPFLASIRIDTSVEPQPLRDSSLPEGIVCAELSGEKVQYSDIPQPLYGAEKPVYAAGRFKAVPYCFWNNRGKGEMLVWMREKE